MRRNYLSLISPYNLYADGGDTQNNTDKLNPIIGGAMGLASSALNSFNQQSQLDTGDINSQIVQRSNQYGGIDSIDSLLDAYNSDHNLNHVKSLSGGQEAMGITSGMLGGAASGAALGSVVPGLGTALGAGIGGLVSGIGGLFGASSRRRKLRKLNRSIDTANENANSALMGKVDYVNSMNDMNRAMNIASYGGLLPSYNVFADGGFTEYPSGTTEVNSGGLHEQNPNGGIQVGIGGNGKPNMLEEGEVKVDNYVFSNRLTPPKDLLKEIGLPIKYADKSFAQIAKLLNRGTKERPNDAITKRGTNSNLDKLKQAQEFIRQSEMAKLVQEQQALQAQENQQVPVNNEGQQEDLPEGMFAYGGDINNNYFDYGGNDSQSYLDTSFINLPDSKVNTASIMPIHFDKIPVDTVGNRLKSIVDLANQYSKNDFSVNDLKPMPLPRVSKPNKSNDKLYSTWLRYAPVLGASVGLASSLFGKDKSIDLPNTIAEASTTSKPVHFNPIGGYYDYRPIDRDYMVNKINQQSATTRDRLADASNGNRAALMSGLINADYSANSAIGDALIKAKQANDAGYLQALQFNRGTDQFNAESQLKADLSNAQEKHYNLNALAQAAELQDRINARKDNAMSANLTNLFNSLGDIGRERFIANMIKSNKALRYGFNLGNGSSYYNG